MLARTIIYPIHMDQDPAELNPVIEMCRAGDAHLTVLVIGLSPPPPIAVDTVILSDTWANQAESRKSELRERAAQIEHRLMQSAISAEVKRALMVDSSVEMTVAEHAFFADLVMLPRTLPGTHGLNEHVAAGAMFGGGKPVVVGQPDQFGALDWKTVLVAWDNERAAARAVSEAIPLLKRAEQVRIACVDPDAIRTASGEAPGWDMATYLARHGIEVVVDTLSSGSRPTSQTIGNFAAEIGADAIVMGAYGHSRLRQRFLGGTTSAIMKACDLPVLMAH
ncbi:MULTISPECIES: universal stress protein [unclassified Roseitalea]|uniref:universal stress protein n=1 Tax=unclassified Roseitalea TaxID=2639107 RepID=UPI00273F41C8|nr:MULTISPECIES: universal stress protein [unclassified Roseitalea]